MDEQGVRAAELAAEQRHVDRVYVRLAQLRAETVRARRQGEELGRSRLPAALVDRDAMVYQLTRRLAALDSEYEGLVFGRLDLRRDGDPETLHIGRLGVRDERYRPLLVDWRAPAAAAFYQATPERPLDVLRRRVIRCAGERVVDVQDELLDPERAPAGLPVVGEGALLATLARATGHQMRDIVATIAREQDEAVRAPASGAVLIAGGPGTGKTAVALHRAAYLLYTDRARFAGGGVLLVGPSPVFMRYIERVLPSLGENTATLRSLGEVLDGVSAARRDEPAVAAVKGSLRMRRVLSRAVRDAPPGVPERLRLVYGGLALTLDAAALRAVRAEVHGRGAPPNQARRYARAALLAALLRDAVAAGGTGYRFDPDRFGEDVADRDEFTAFLHAWWPVRTPAGVLAGLADPDRLARAAGRTLRTAEVGAVAASFADATAAGGPGGAGQGFSVEDVALLDELRVLLGEPPKPPAPRPDPSGVRELTTWADRETPYREPVERPDDYDEYAHVVVDEAQDLSPMQWRMLGRRGRQASWTIVGDPAQSAWPDPDEADRARDAALRGTKRHEFELTTNYRNSAEIFAVAERVIRKAEPGVRLPAAVRTTGVEPRVKVISAGEVAAETARGVAELLGEVAGTVGVVAPADRLPDLSDLTGSDRISLLTPLDAKGLEYDGVLVVEPEGIARGAGGAHTLYVVLTRATQRLTVLTTEAGWPN